MNPTYHPALLGNCARVLVGGHEVTIGEARFDLDFDSTGRMGRVCGYGLTCHDEAYVVVEWVGDGGLSLEVELLGPLK
jgi:hypothetical protein